MRRVRILAELLVSLGDVAEPIADIWRFDVGRLVAPRRRTPAVIFDDIGG